MTGTALPGWLRGGAPPAPPVRDAATGAGAAAVPDRAEGQRALLRGFQVMLIGAIPLQRFGIPVAGQEIALGLAVTLAVVGWLALRGLLRVDPARTALYALTVGVAALAAAVNPATTSATSFALLAVAYAPFVFVAGTGRDTFLATLGTFQALVLVCAVLGIAQFLLQFVVDAPLLFTFEGTLPDAILMLDFNTAVPLSYGSPVMKSNGFLLLEPSMFSQYLALALLIEILFFMRRWRLAVYAVAVPISYSGTGLLLLMAFLPLVVLHRRAFGFVVGGAVGGAVAVMFGDLWHMDALLARVYELQYTQSSGFARFVSAIWLIRDFTADSLSSVLLGLGPGSISDVVTQVPYEAHDPTWGKLLFEYGLVGAFVFGAFFLACLFPGAHSHWVAGFLLFGFLFFGGMLLDPRLGALILALCVLQRRAAEEDTPARRSGGAVQVEQQRSVAGHLLHPGR